MASVAVLREVMLVGNRFDGGQIIALNRRAYLVIGGGHQRVDLADGSGHRLVTIWIGGRVRPNTSQTVVLQTRQELSGVIMPSVGDHDVVGQRSRLTFVAATTR